MLQEISWLLPVALLLGVFLGWALGYALGGRRGQRRLIASAQELSAAETTARAERERRAESEGELRETEARLSSLDRELAVARERVATGAQLVNEQKNFIESSRKELEDAFQSLAAAALKGTSEQFLTLAQQRLETTRTRANADLEERRQAVENLVTPLRETLEKLDRKTTELERSRAADTSRIGEQVEQLARSTTLLRDETSSLASALRGTESGGRWGELALKRVVEIAGMTAHCDFEEQLTIEGGTRPDMVVNLPEGRRIAVDAKAPLGAFMEASNATTNRPGAAALDRHTKALRAHVRQLALRDYARVPGRRHGVRRPLPAGGRLSRSGVAARPGSPGRRAALQGAARHPDDPRRAAAHRRDLLAAAIDGRERGGDLGRGA